MSILQISRVLLAVLLALVPLTSADAKKGSPRAPASLFQAVGNLVVGSKFLMPDIGMIEILHQYANLTKAKEDPADTPRYVRVSSEIGGHGNGFTRPELLYSGIFDHLPSARIPSHPAPASQSPQGTRPTIDDVKAQLRSTGAWIRLHTFDLHHGARGTMSGSRAENRLEGIQQGDEASSQRKESGDNPRHVAHRRSFFVAVLVISSFTLGSLFAAAAFFIAVVNDNHHALPIALLGAAIILSGGVLVCHWFLVSTGRI